VKLVTVTRQDITPGYQVAQTKHAALEFAYHHNEVFRQWKSESNSVITLAAKDEQSLLDLYTRLEKLTPHLISFREPDIDDQMTALCVYGTPEIRKMLSSYPLALREKKLKPQTV